MAPHSSEKARTPWLTKGVVGIGFASFLSDLGHEVPTSLLPSLLATVFSAPAAVLGVIEGIADALAGIARLIGGALADDPNRRRATAVGGYTSTAILSGLIGAAQAVWQVALFRIGAWVARGLRVPSRNALLADAVSPEVHGRAYGFERAMDNLGAIGGPLLAIGLLAVVGIRTAILLSVIPGLLAAVAIVYAIRHTPRPVVRERARLRLRVRPVLAGQLGRLMGAVSAFEFGNVAATLLILRATTLLRTDHAETSSVQIALLLYTGYNVAATLTSVPAGRLSDRRGSRIVLAVGSAAFLAGYLGFALGSSSVLVLAIAFAAAGVGIGFVETAQHAAVASLAPENLRGSAFGLLAAIQSFGNLAASLVAGVIWTAISPRAAFVYLATWMAVAFVGFVSLRSEVNSGPSD